MKIVHVLKRIETIDQDVKDLRKLEKSLQSDKSFSTPIYMTIEKQISLLVGERVKLLELQVSNPPESLIEEFKESDDEGEVKVPTPLKKKAKRVKKSAKSSSSKPKKQPVELDDDDDIDDIPLQMLTQDSIDSKIQKIQKDLPKEKPLPEPSEFEDDVDDISDDNVKLLDIALRQGSINKDEITKEKKRVKFFRDNFPGAEY